MNVVEKIRIAATPAQVFGYLTDVENRKEFVPALEEVIMIDPLPLKSGSRYIEVAAIAGRRLETMYQITAIDCPRKLSAKTIRSVFPIEVDLLLNETAGATDLTIVLDFHLTGVFRLASGVVRGIVSMQARGILNKLKSKLEAGATYL